MSKRGKMVREGGLPDLQCVRKLANAQVGEAKCLDDSQPDRVAQHLANGGGLLHSLRVPPYPYIRIRLLADCGVEGPAGDRIIGE